MRVFEHDGKDFEVNAFVYVHHAFVKSSLKRIQLNSV